MLIASTDQGLAQICEENPELPDDKTIYRWLIKHEIFREMYTRAKEIQQLGPMGESLINISDDGRNDWMKRLAFNGGNPSWEVNGENINRSKLRVETRKWLMAKLAPKKYGEAQQIDMTVKGGMDNTLKIEFVEPKKAAE